MLIIQSLVEFDAEPLEIPSNNKLEIKKIK